MSAPPDRHPEHRSRDLGGPDRAGVLRAFRAKITNPIETRFIDSSGDWIMAHQVALDQPWRGLTKLAKMAALAIEEALQDLDKDQWHRLPLLLCVAEPERPGRLAGLDDQLLTQIQSELGVSFAHPSAVVPHGRVGVAVALAQARSLDRQRQRPECPDCRCRQPALMAHA